MKRLFVAIYCNQNCNIFLFLQFVQDVKHPAFPDVFSMYRHLLTDKSTSLVFKVTTVFFVFKLRSVESCIL